MQRYHVPDEIGLEAFLYDEDKETLPGLENVDRVRDLLNHCFHEQLSQLWISLYVAAIRQRLNPEEFAVIISFYAHRGENIKPILALQAIAANAGEFRPITPPPVNSFKISAGADYKSQEVADAVNQYYTKPKKYYSKDWEDSGKKDRHDSRLKKLIADIKTTIKASWPCASFDLSGKWSFKYIHFVKATAAVNAMLKTWHENYQLKVFIKRVETQLQSRSPGSIRRLNLDSCLRPSTARNWGKTCIDYEAKMRENSKLFPDVIGEASNIWQTNTNSTRSADDWWQIFEQICDSIGSRHLIRAGIFPRVVPSLFLPRIMDSEFDEGLKALDGAFALALTREQRENRHEIHEPYTNWSPREYPEWLLFEIEQNLTIRRIQIEIARRMIDPPEIATKNSVMQLNMGEGKTSVIVPILAARLADGTQVSQIIVLKSLFATNMKSLRQYLGGLLHRRVYTFPCRRDMPIESHAHEILQIYQECLREKGTTFTLEFMANWLIISVSFRCHSHTARVLLVIQAQNLRIDSESR